MTWENFHDPHLISWNSNEPKGSTSNFSPLPRYDLVAPTPSPRINKGLRRFDVSNIIWSRTKNRSNYTFADLSLQADDFYFMFWWARQQWLHSYLFMVISFHSYRSYHIPNVETGAIRCSAGHSFYQSYTVRSKRTNRAKLRIYASPVFDCFCVSFHG